jgi:signal transduction histidine kinase
MPAAQREVVARIRRSIRNALALIDDLHELARAEAGHIELACEPVDVGALVRELAEDYRAAAVAHGLGLRAEVAAGLPPVTGDATRVRQVLGNLLSNAVKYTDHGGVTVRAAAHGAGRPDGAPADAPAWVTVAVADTGPGIARDEQRRLFREFSRLHRGDKPGAGLGLAISQRVARALGGAITVDSEAGRGSVFTLWMPAGAVAAAGAPAPAAAPAHAPAVRDPVA